MIEQRLPTDSWHICPKCRKVLRVGVEVHGIKQCLEWAGSMACGFVLPLPWHLHSVYPLDNIWFIKWRNGSLDEWLEYAISEHEYRYSVLSITAIIEGWLTDKMEVNRSS